MATGQKNVVVVGAGVLGLNSALRLSDAGYRVTVIARHLPGDLHIDYASPWAGAHFRPVPVTKAAEALERELSVQTFAFFRDIAAKHPESGISICKGIEYFDSPSSTYTDLKAEQAYSTWDGFRVLSDEEIPSTAKWGVEYDAWILNSPHYLQWLQNWLFARGVQFIRAGISHLAEAAVMLDQKLAPIIVNTTGVGLDDPDAYISRGQFLLVENEYDRTISHHHADGTSTVVVPRPCGGGTLIGGSKEPRDNNPDPDDATTQWILAQVSQLCPDMLRVSNENGQGCGGLKVLRVNVGRRPMRKGGLRCEHETLKHDESSLHVVHCYGAGGSGFKISWGAAGKVVELVNQFA